MHPMQLASLAVYMANHPSRFGALRHANTSTGQTARQNPQALHMSSEMRTSHLPAGPRDAFLSALNSGIPGSVAHHPLGHASDHASSSSARGGGAIPADHRILV